MQIRTLEEEISNKRKFSSAEKKKLNIAKDCRLNEFTVLGARQVRKGTNLGIF